MPARWIFVVAGFAIASCSSSSGETPSTPAPSSGVEPTSPDVASSEVTDPVESAPVESVDPSETTEAPFTIDGPAQVDLEQLDPAATSPADETP